MIHLSGCCGDPGDCTTTPCTQTACICDLELRSLDVFDVRCPRHGLATFLRSVVQSVRVQHERRREALNG